MLNSKQVISTLWLLSEKVVSMGLSLIVSVLLARHLAPTAFGELSYFIALVSLLAPIMTLGLNSLLTREVLDKKKNEGIVLGTALILRVVSGLCVFVASILVSLLVIGDSLSFEIQILIIASIFNAGLVFDFWLQAHLKNKLASIIRTCTLVLMSIVRLVAIYFDASVTDFVLIQAIHWVLTGIAFLICYLSTRKTSTQLLFDINEAKYLMPKGALLMLSGIAAIVYLKIDQIMLAHLLNSEAVGLYAVAARMSEIWYFIPVAIVTSIFPMLIEFKESDQKLYWTKVQRLNDLLFAIGIFIAVLITLTANFFVPILFGVEYADAAPVLVLHVWAGVFIFMRALLSKWFITENLFLLSFYSQLLGALINVVCNYFFIQWFGILGAAWATIISYGVSSYIALLFHRSGWPMFKVINKTLFFPLRFIMRN
jgi:PST family polysaccharide transporter